MRRAAVIGVAVAALATGYASAKQGAPRSGLPARFGLGRAATAAEIKAWDIDVMPDGDGLPHAAARGDARARSLRRGRPARRAGDPVGLDATSSRGEWI